MFRTKGNATCLAYFMAVAGIFMLSGCATTTKCCVSEAGVLKTPAIAVSLPEKYNTPDGMMLYKGDILLSIPNANNQDYIGTILKIDENDNCSEFIALPPHPETGKVFPLGIIEGTDGHIYVADNQAFSGAIGKSRLLRITMKRGKPVSCATVVEGFVIANGIASHDGYIYVAETQLIPTAYPLPSGVYRFKLSELDEKNPIRLKRGGEDEHLIIKIETHKKDTPFGSNGVGIDRKGNVYLTNFGDAQILKFTFDKKGNVASQEVFVEDPAMLSADGIKVDSKMGVIYIADFSGNAIHTACLCCGKVTTLAKNGITDGSYGLLDRPSEVCRRGNLLYISNIDLTGGDNAFDAPHNISVIDLNNR